jgi:hypothetical protein
LCRTASDLPAAAGGDGAPVVLAAAAHGEGTKDDVFLIRVWQALAGIELPKKAGGGCSQCSVRVDATLPVARK